MNKQLLREINQRLVELRKSRPMPSNKREAPALQYLREQLAGELQKPLRSHLLTMLSNEYGYLDLPEEEESVLLQAIDLEPAEPLPRIALATFLQGQPGRLNDALSAAKIAIKCAETTGRFRRHALQTLARILRDRKDYTELVAAFQSLSALHVDKGMADSVVENDFLIGLPEGVIDGDLLKKVRDRK